VATSEWWAHNTARTELWFAWLEIAVEHEERALDARVAAIEAKRTGGNIAEALETETKSAMAAVVAAAAALETIGNNLDRFLDMPVTAPGLAGRVAKVINGVFGDVVPAALRDQMRWLVDLRNDTIHYRADWHAIDLHPVLGVPTTLVARVYGVEAATKSVDVVLRAVKVATNPGRSKSDEAEFWAIHWRSLPSEIEERRQRT